MKEERLLYLKKQKITKFALLLLSALLVSGCFGDNKKSQVEQSASELYVSALAVEKKGNVKLTIESFNEVERQHPQSNEAKLALAKIVVIAYESGNYPLAVSNAEQFVTLNPNHKLASKIYYIRALSFYNQISDIGRDQGHSFKALNTMNDVIFSYPDSNYAISANVKIDFIRDQLAGKELEVGRFYLKAGHYQAAIKRFSNVLDEYPETSQIPEALARIVESYLAIGQLREAEKTASILSYNYKGNKWYKYSYEIIKDFGK